jgi:enoyl-CoA hydratase/carnithine racemase
VTAPADPTRTGSARTAASGPVTVSTGEAGTVHVQLGRPDRANALNEPLVEALLAAVAAARGDGTRVMVISGSGRHFCAGFDMQGALERSVGDLLLRFVRIEQLLAAVRRAPFTTVAYVRGSAVGAGADLVAACSHRLLDPGARMRFPGFGFGVVLGTRHLASLVGGHTARELVGSGRQVKAAEALRLGLATDLVGAEELDRALARVVGAQAGLDDTSLAECRRRTADADVDREDDADLAALVRSLVRPGLLERLTTYLEGLR